MYLQYIQYFQRIVKETTNKTFDWGQPVIKLKTSRKTHTTLVRMRSKHTATLKIGPDDQHSYGPCK